MADAPGQSKRVSTSSSKRQSTLHTSSAVPKPPCTIDPLATVATSATLAGTFQVSIGPRAVLHPHSTVSATAGPVEIAEGVVIWERAVVGSLGGSSSTTVLEKNVVVETGAGIGVGARVGEGSVVECFAKVGSGAQVGKYCKIVPYANVPAGAVVPDYTVVYGTGARRRMDSTTRESDIVANMRAMAHHKQLKGLQVLIPSNLAKWQS